MGGLFFMKLGIKIVLKIASFLIGFYIIVAFVFNPKIFVLLIPPFLIIGFLLFIMYKFARPQFDKLVNFFRRNKNNPTSSFNRFKQSTTRDFNNHQQRQAISQKNLDLLQQLDQLRQQGILSEQEFEEKKKQILRL